MILRADRFSVGSHRESHGVFEGERSPSPRTARIWGRARCSCFARSIHPRRSPCAGDGKCAKELSKADEKYQRAERYAAEGRIDKAIGELKKAWEKAVRAAR